jgi:hypothetical protein
MSSNTQDVKKTIKINPDIFNIGSRKNKERKNNKTMSIPPIVSPNLLKNKLLKRIKEHKENENQPTKATENTNTGTNTNDPYTDEFNDSLTYLQSLSKEKKKKDEIEKRKASLMNKTVRHIVPSSSINNYDNSNIQVQLDLPDELIIPNIPISNETETMKINYKVDNAIPYGCLKGGYKPTYRTLNKTHKNYDITNESDTLNINNINTQREQRLNILKNKIKSKQQVPVSTTSSLLDNNSRLHEPIYSIPNPISNSPPLPNFSLINSSSKPNLSQYPVIISQADPIKVHTNKLNTTIPLTSVSTQEDLNSNISNQKQLIKKTMRKKYTLGKSNIHKQVSILIKDQKTRKNIITAQKELKHHTINDIKAYLRKHNLIKMGSIAPNDVIRKLYESCMLAGDITNLNKETVLHNLIKETY